MAYGKLKVDTITYDNAGSDVDVSVSALAGAGSAAPLNNPTFTGTPAAPTASAGTNTTQLATTAFVTTAVGTAAPLSGATFSGDVTTQEALVIERVKEKVSVVASAATGTINIDAKDQAIVYYSANASANFVINVRGDASTTLTSLMAVGQSLTVVFVHNNGSSAYYPTSITLDGSAPTVIKWSGGAPTSGTASSVTTYSISIIKTGASAFTALASQTAYES